MTKAICTFSDFWFEVRSLLDERRPRRANLNFLPADVGAQLADAAAPLLAHDRYGRAGDVNHAIEVGIHHRLEPLRAQLLERRDIAVGRYSRQRRDVQMRHLTHAPYTVMQGAHYCMTLETSLTWALRHSTPGLSQMRGVFEDKLRDERRQADHEQQSHRLQGQHERQIDLRSRTRNDGYRVKASWAGCKICGECVGPGKFDEALCRCRTKSHQSKRRDDDDRHGVGRMDERFAPET